MKYTCTINKSRAGQHFAGEYGWIDAAKWNVKNGDEVEITLENNRITSVAKLFNISLPLTASIASPKLYAHFINEQWPDDLNEFVSDNKVHVNGTTIPLLKKYTTNGNLLDYQPSLNFETSLQELKALYIEYKKWYYDIVVPNAKIWALNNIENIVKHYTLESWAKELGVGDKYRATWPHYATFNDNWVESRYNNISDVQYTKTEMLNRMQHEYDKWLVFAGQEIIYKILSNFNEFLKSVGGNVVFVSVAEFTKTVETETEILTFNYTAINSKECGYWVGVPDMYQKFYNLYYTESDVINKADTSIYNKTFMFKEPKTIPTEEVQIGKYTYMKTGNIYTKKLK